MSNKKTTQEAYKKHRKRKILINIATVIIIGAAIATYDHRWDIYMLSIPDMHNLPIETAGYKIEQLPFDFHVSFVRGNNLYFVDGAGKVLKADDNDPINTLTQIGHARVSPRLLFVSTKGTIFVAGNDPIMKRSTDGGKTWEVTLELPFWRMDEDEATNTLYAGNYSPRDHPVDMATIFKSNDEGKTWKKVFSDNRLDHVHTVRYDQEYRRIYIATGDTSYRGEAYSDDQGKSWQWIDTGRGNGHTDVAFTNKFVLWGSDDSYGRICYSPRNPVSDCKDILFGRYHQVWWIIAKSKQIYAGTFVDDAKSRSGAFLLASNNEGQTWQKLMEVGKPGAGAKAFFGESRNISSSGWIYFITSTGKSYRVKKL